MPAIVVIVFQVTLVSIKQISLNTLKSLPHSLLLPTVRAVVTQEVSSSHCMHFSQGRVHSSNNPQRGQGLFLLPHQAELGEWACSVDWNFHFGGQFQNLYKRVGCEQTYFFFLFSQSQVFYKVDFDASSAHSLVIIFN